MRWLALVLAFVFMAFAEELKLAEVCDQEKCKLPDCKCSTTDIPGGFLPHRVPQFVLLTFDDGVTVSNHPTYQTLLYGRKNFNNCPVGATFFVSHEYTNYQLVNDLYTQGFEIAMHSISHVNQTYFMEADKERLMEEIGDQKTLTSNFAAIPAAAIQGLRMPFLQMAGNASFEMMKTAGFRYDISMPTIKFQSPGLWPYTLDYASDQDCINAPCPTASFPGLWAVPMIAWEDLEGFPCAMVDACFSPPGDADEEGWFRFIVKNFEKQYLGNRAPFGFYIHEGPVRTRPGLQAALIRFLNMINTMNDVYLVNVSEMLDWVEKPIPLEDYVKAPCRATVPARRCRPTNCGPLSSTHTQESFWMASCTSCPRVYPWVGNPLGR
ncbi:unnamed protein product [Leptosia nina]|uniref:NodB homology domain-containing protein n=1 Tax=Leptosia nina TaxID=320188 RepID=A0AAV1JI12_9NEOP